MQQAPESNLRTNTVLAAWVCIALGSGIILSSGISAFALAVAVPLAIAGIVLLVVGVRGGGRNRQKTKKKIAQTPETVSLSDPILGKRMGRF